MKIKNSLLHGSYFDCSYVMRHFFGILVSAPRCKRIGSYSKPFYLLVCLGSSEKDRLHLFPQLNL